MRKLSGTSSYLTNDIPWPESIYIKSRLLLTSINETATCYFNETQEGHGSDDLHARPTQGLKYPYERYEIAKPQLFFYHHKDRLKSYADSHEDSRAHVDALLSYCNDRYKSNFQEADKIFSRGLVNRLHIEKLFVPNRVVITKISGVISACVLQDWPVLEFNGTIRLRCWYWLPDGSGISRCALIVSISSLGEDMWNIVNLSAIPLRFAHPELVAKILLRGRKYWNVLDKSHVSYRGWNVQMEEFYVS